MKRHVSVCDHDEMGPCRRLADQACVLCSKEYCFEHMKGDVAITFEARLAAPPPAGSPHPQGQPYHVRNNACTTAFGICTGCFYKLGALERDNPNFASRGVFRTLLDDAREAARETAMAALATSALEKSK